MSNVTYRVKLQRTTEDTKLGPAMMTLNVHASSSSAAKLLGESMARGYIALTADPQR